MSTKYPRTDDSRHLVGGSELVKVYAGRKISRLTRHRRPTASVLNYAFGPSVTMQGVNKCEQYIITEFTVYILRSHVFQIDD